MKYLPCNFRLKSKIIRLRERMFWFHPDLLTPHYNSIRYLHGLYIFLLIQEERYTPEIVDSST